jgi:hypothetical protein
MQTRCLVAVLSALWLAAGARGAAQNAVVVLPGSDETASLQAAIDAAADGDILILHGTWGTATDGTATGMIDGKGLTLVAAAGTQPVLFRVFVSNVPEGSQVVLRGLDFDDLAGQFSSYEFGSVDIADCAGGVWVEDCSIQGIDGLGFIFGSSSPGFPALSVKQSTAVNIVHCALNGGAGATQGGFGMGFHPAEDGGDGAHLVGSSVRFSDCSFRGGPAGTGDTQESTTGGEGLQAQDSAVLFSDCHLHGGDDVDTTTSPGAGLFVEGSSSVMLRDSSVTAGAGLPAAAGVVAPPGAVTHYTAPARTIEVDSPLHEHEAGTLHVIALPGDVALLFAGFQGAFVSLPGKQGVLALGAPLAGPFTLGVVPSTPWDVAFTAPDLVSPLLMGWTTLLQLVVVGPAGGALIEGTTSFVLLDDSLP